MKSGRCAGRPRNVARPASFFPPRYSTTTTHDNKKEIAKQNINDRKKGIDTPPNKKDDRHFCLPMKKKVNKIVQMATMMKQTSVRFGRANGSLRRSWKTVPSVKFISGFNESHARIGSHSRHQAAFGQGHAATATRSFFFFEIFLWFLVQSIKYDYRRISWRGRWR